jgi:membrane-associated PAP2 superfamily phosphatase
MKTFNITGAKYVHTDPGEALSVRPQITSKVWLDNGERVQIKHAASAGTVIAQSQSLAEIIPAPPTGYYIVILGMKLMADAATVVTLKSASTAVDGPWPLATNGGAIDWFSFAGLFRCQPAEALNITTGAGGNTSYRIDYIEVPLNVDIL